MYHYIGLVWNPLDIAAQRRARALCGELDKRHPPWKRSLDLPGVAVYTEASRDRALREYALPHESGLILGTLFYADLDTTCLRPLHAVRETDASEFAETGGHSLNKKFWGNYIGFLRKFDGATTYVVRDCSGKLPCYFLQHESVAVFFSEVSDLSGLSIGQLSLDVNYLTAFLAKCDLQIRPTGIKQIREVLAGDRVRVSGGHIEQSCLWDPTKISEDRLDDYDRAAERLGFTVERCIKAWSTVHERIVLSLSGGLDSAIVLGCLRDNSPSASVTCFHLFGSDPASDERRFARVAALRNGVALREHHVDPRDIVFDSELIKATNAIKPQVQSLFMAVELEATRYFAEQTGSDSVWTGQGGDHLFLESKSSHAAADYLVNRGPDLGLVPAVIDAANLSREPYVHVLRDAFRLSRRGVLWKPEDRISPFLCSRPQGALPVEYVEHPWPMNSINVGPGKLSQIYYLVDVLHRHRPRARLQHVTEHHPLLSQPVIELCLRIPTYRLLQGGRQRSLARDTFRTRVPPEILAREDKGDITILVTEVIRKSSSFIQEMLFDGFLAKHDLIDREKIERYISHRTPFAQSDVRPMLACLAAEVWARSWNDTLLRIAA